MTFISPSFQPEPQRDILYLRMGLDADLTNQNTGGTIFFDSPDTGNSPSINLHSRYNPVNGIWVSDFDGLITAEYITRFLAPGAGSLSSYQVFIQHQRITGTTFTRQFGLDNQQFSIANGTLKSGATFNVQDSDRVQIIIGSCPTNSTILGDATNPIRSTAFTIKRLYS